MQLISFILSATADSENVAAIIPVCDDGWNKFEAHCYFYSGGKELKLSWANAEKDCINRGGHLASIHSQAEQLFVFSISTIPTWLGASDIISEVCFPSSLSSIWFSVNYVEIIFLKSCWDKKWTHQFAAAIHSYDTSLKRKSFFIVLITVFWVYLHTFWNKTLLWWDLAELWMSGYRASDCQCRYNSPGFDPSAGIFKQFMGTRNLLVIRFWFLGIDSWTP